MVVPAFGLQTNRVSQGEVVVFARLSLAVALFGFAVLLGPGTALADTITPLFSDGFESDTPDVLDAVLNNWTVSSGSVDVLSAGNLCNIAGGTSNCVDLDGTGRSAGTIWSKQTFAVGAGTYRLTFDLAGANRPWLGSESNTVNVSFGGYFAEDFTMFRNDPFQTITRDILIGGPGTANIVFSHQGADWIGLLLDNVSLSSVIIDVPDEPNVVPSPEPATWTLLGAALGLIALHRFRKRV